MKKINKIALVGLMAFSGQHVFCASSKASAKKAVSRTDLSPWDAIFYDIDENFNNEFIGDNEGGAQVTVEDESFFAGTEDVAQTLQKIRELSYKLDQVASRGLWHLSTHSLDSMNKALQDAYQQVKESADSWPQIADDIEKNIKQVEQFKRFGIKAKEVDNQYVVEITMPGFDEKDIKVTVAKSDKGAFGVRKTLTVVAPKAEVAPAAAEEKASEEKTAEETTPKVTPKRAYSSLTVVNGRMQKIIYENGRFEAVCDIPENVDDKGNTMILQDGTLSITFKKLEKDLQNQELQFSQPATVAKGEKQAE